MKIYNAVKKYGTRVITGTTLALGASFASAAQFDPSAAVAAWIVEIQASIASIATQMVEPMLYVLGAMILFGLVKTFGKKAAG